MQINKTILIVLAVIVVIAIYYFTREKEEKTEDFKGVQPRSLRSKIYAEYLDNAQGQLDTQDEKTEEEKEELMKYFLERKEYLDKQFQQILQKQEHVKQKLLKMREQYVSNENLEVEYPRMNLKLFNNYKSRLSDYQKNYIQLSQISQNLVKNTNDQIEQQSQELQQVNQDILELQELILQINEVYKKYKELLDELLRLDRQKYYLLLTDIEKQKKYIDQNQKQIQVLFGQIYEYQQTILYYQDQFKEDPVVAPVSVSLQNIPVNSQYLVMMYNSENCPRFKELLDKYDEDLAQTKDEICTYNVIFNIPGDGSNYLDNTKILFSKNGRNCLYFYKRKLKSTKDQEYYGGNNYLILRTNLVNAFQPSETDKCYILNQMIVSSYFDDDKAFSFSPILVASRVVSQFVEKQQVDNDQNIIEQINFDFVFDKNVKLLGSFCVVNLHRKLSKTFVISLSWSNLQIQQGILAQTTQPQIDAMDYERDYSKYFEGFQRAWLDVFQVNLKDLNPFKDGIPNGTFFFSQFRQTNEDFDTNINSFGRWQYLVDNTNLYPYYLFNYLQDSLLNETPQSHLQLFNDVYGAKLPIEKFEINDFGHMQVSFDDNVVLQQGYKFDSFLGIEFPFVINYIKTMFFPNIQLMQTLQYSQSQINAKFQQSLISIQKQLLQPKKADNYYLSNYYYQEEIFYSSKQVETILLSNNQKIGFKLDYIYRYKTDLVPINVGCLLYETHPSYPIYQGQIIQSYPMYLNFDVIQDNKFYLVKFLQSVKLSLSVINNKIALSFLTLAYPRQYFNSQGEAQKPEDFPQGADIVPQRQKMIINFPDLDKDWQLVLDENLKKFQVIKRIYNDFNTPDSIEKYVYVDLQTIDNQFLENLNFDFNFKNSSNIQFKLQKLNQNKNNIKTNMKIKKI